MLMITSLQRRYRNKTVRTDGGTESGGFLLPVRKVLLSFMIILNFSLPMVFAQVQLSPEESDKLVIEKIDPAYPPFAKRMKLQGTVKVEVTISEAGEVISSKVISGNPVFKLAALEAVKKRKYRPYVVDGKPAPFVTTIDVLFSLGVPQDEYERQQEISRKFFQEEEKCRDLLRSQKLKEAEAVCKANTQIADQLSSDRALEKMGAYQLVGHVMMRQQRYQEALDNYHRALYFAQLTLKNENAELGQLYGEMALANHFLRHLDKARELYRKAERSLQLAYADMACGNCDEEVNRIRQDYMKLLNTILEYHIRAAQEAGAAAEVEEIKKLRQSLPK